MGRSSRRVVIAGLGIFGAALVASGAQEPAGQAASVTLSGGDRPISAVREPAASAPVDSIRSVDFGDLPQPGAACATALPWTPPRRVDVRGGSSSILDLGMLTRLVVHPGVVYGDVDGDGQDDAVVHVTCAYGANAADDSVHVWSLQRGAPYLRASVAEPPLSVTGSLPPAVEHVAVSGGRVAVTWTHYADADPNCCPSLETTIRYTFDGGRLQPGGSPVTRPGR